MSLDERTKWKIADNAIVQLVAFLVVAAAIFVVARLFVG